MRDLVIREGEVMMWENDTPLPESISGKVFYEVLPRSKIASQVLEFARQSR